jgi:small conductance mechanosensitive channel
MQTPPSDTLATPENPLVLISSRVSAAIDGFFLQLPNILATAVFVVLVYFAAKYLGRLVTRVVARRDRPDLGTLMGSLTTGTIWIIGLLGAAAILFPSVNPGSILAGLGVGSVAIGFAFKDILQNLLAGILLLIQRPYKRGDQITVLDYEGTIEHIESRATSIKTYDGRRVVIPNAALYTAPVEVHTAFDIRRDDYDVGIGYADDPEKAARLFLDAIKDLEGVQSDPAPEVLPWSLDDSYVTLRVRWWTKSLRTNMVHVRPRVIIALYKTAKAHAIDLPFPTSIMLVHDQTEDTDGDRARQREGWPTTGRDPKPRSPRGPEAALPER